MEVSRVSGHDVVVINEFRQDVIASTTLVITTAAIAAAGFKSVIIAIAIAMILALILVFWMRNDNIVYLSDEKIECWYPIKRRWVTVDLKKDVYYCKTSAWWISISNHDFQPITRWKYDDAKANVIGVCIIPKKSRTELPKDDWIRIDTAYWYSG